MRIGVDIRCLMDGRRTGVEEYTLHVLRAMSAAAPDDTFILFANARKPLPLPAVHGPNVTERTFTYPNKFLNASLKLLRQPHLDTLVGGVDVFYVPSVRLAPLSPRSPLVVTVHDLSFVRHPQFFTRERRLWHRLMEPERLVRRAAAILTVSTATARDVVSLYGVPAARVHVVHSGIPPAIGTLDAEGEARRAAAARARYRLPEHFLLFLGTLEPRKNLDGLLLAYARLRRDGFPHALVLAGIRGWIDQRFFSRISEHPFARDIILTGFVEDGDKETVYRLADLFVYPSFYEGFGFPPLEALAAGTPVVTSYNSAIPEICGPWATMVNPYDPEELALVIEERLRAPARVKEDVSRAIRARYAWERAGRDTLAVLRAAAENPEYDIRNPKQRGFEFRAQIL